MYRRICDTGTMLSLESFPVGPLGCNCSLLWDPATGQGVVVDPGGDGAKIRKRVETNYRATFTYTPAVLDSIIARCKEVQSGARNIDHILSRGLLPALSEKFLSCLAEERRISAVEISVDQDGNFIYGIA